MVKEIFLGTIASTKWFFIKNVDKILLVGGIAANGAAVVTAVKATSKVDDEIKNNIEKIKKLKAELEDESAIANKIVDPEVNKKAITKEYLKIGGKLVKLYAPSVGLFLGGTGMIVGGHHIIKQRLASSTALLAATQNSFDRYRGRVAEAIGTEAEQKIFDNKLTKKIEVEEKDPKTGEVKKVTKEVEVTSEEAQQEYNRFKWGAESSPGYYTYRYSNIETLRYFERQLTDRLKTQKYLFLSEVLDYIGCDLKKVPEWKLKAIQSVGWVYNPEDPNLDNFVSFGLEVPGTRDLTREAKAFDLDLINEITLTFNVVGDIINGQYDFTEFIKRQ